MLLMQPEVRPLSGCAGDKSQRGMSDDFVMMLLRAYDECGRDVFSSDSDDDSAFSDSHSSGFGNGGGRVSDCEDGTSRGATRRTHVLQKSSAGGQRPVGSGKDPASARHPTAWQPRNSRSERALQFGSAAAAQLGGPDGRHELLGWAAGRASSGGDDVVTGVARRTSRARV